MEILPKSDVAMEKMLHAYNHATYHKIVGVKVGFLYPDKEKKKCPDCERLGLKA